MNDGVSVVSLKKSAIRTPSSVKLPFPNEFATGIAVSDTPLGFAVCTCTFVPAIS